MPHGSTVCEYTHTHTRWCIEGLCCAELRGLELDRASLSKVSLLASDYLLLASYYLLLAACDLLLITDY